MLSVGRLFLQKLDLSDAKTASGPIAGNLLLNAGDGSAETTDNERVSTAVDDLRMKLEQRDEEVKLYRGKYEESMKQITHLVCHCLLSDIMTSVLVQNIHNYVHKRIW